MPKIPDLSPDQTNLIIGALYDKLVETNRYITSHPGGKGTDIDPDCCSRCSDEHFRWSDFRDQYDSLLERRASIQALIDAFEATGSADPEPDD